DPLPVGETVGEKLFAVRRRQGISQKVAARVLGSIRRPWGVGSSGREFPRGLWKTESRNFSASSGTETHRRQQAGPSLEDRSATVRRSEGRAPCDLRLTDGSVRREGG